MAQRYPLADQCVMFDESTNRLRWFMLPSEAQDLLLGNSQNVKHDVPFDPAEYSGSRGSVAEVPFNVSSCALPLSQPICFGSPRHNSLPCASRTEPESMGPPTVSVMYPSLLNTSSGSEGFLHKHKPTSPLDFAVGEVMNPAAVMTKLPLGMAHSIRNECLYPPRTRCHSLGSCSGTLPQILSPQTMASLGIGVASTGSMKQQQCSCSSQTDLNSLEMDSMPSLNLLQLNASSATDCSATGRSSPTPSSISTQSPEDLEAYVKEVTKELATEIKSEIRDVISKVEDVLSESTDSAAETCSCFSQQLVNSSLDRLHSGSGESIKGDSVSANDIAEYLMEVSREMASEVKSEIREMVNAVDVLISPDVQSQEEKSSSANSPVGTPGSYSGITGCLNTKLGELSGERTQSSECSSDETVVQILSVDAKNGHTAGNETDEEASEGVPLDNKQCHQKRSTINSVSSQDSGINLSFQESDSASHGTTERRTSELASRCIRKTNDLSDSSSSSSVAGGAKLGGTEQFVSAPAEVPSRCASGACFVSLEATAPQTVGGNVARWHCPPKSIWKPAVEVHFIK